MKDTAMDTETLRELAAKATPGPWGIWFEQINGQADKAIQEFVEQVHATDPIGNSLVMLDASGKCPAITGCGPFSAVNAALIVHLVNSIPEILAMAERVRVLEDALVQHNDRLRSAASIADRDGKNTNWQSFRGQCHYTLAEYHELTNECRRAAGDFIVAQPGLESTALSKEPRT